jgi:hypothetical protein
MFNINHDQTVLLVQPLNGEIVVPSVVLSKRMAGHDLTRQASSCKSLLHGNTNALQVLTQKT